MPSFSPNCRRLTPGPGYLEASAQPNVKFIRWPFQRLTEYGIMTVDRVERKVDAIIYATGANKDMLPPLPIRATTGSSLQDAWTPDPYTCLGTATPCFPILLFIHGPNGTEYIGKVPNQIEIQVTYIAQLLRKVSKQHIRTFIPLKAATDDLMDYSDAFFAGTI